MPSKQTAATWDAVLEYVLNAPPGGVTNRQIATGLSLDLSDVTALTRMIVKAGEIRRMRHHLGGVGSASVFSAPEQAEQRVAR